MNKLAQTLLSETPSSESAHITNISELLFQAYEIINDMAS